MNDEDRKIPILVEINETRNEKHAFGRPTKMITQVVEIYPEVISKNLEFFLANFEPVLNGPGNNLGEFEIDEIELNLNVNAEGGISLIGAIKAGVAASFKVKLKRKSK
ncbi:MAG: Pepco domain-containing protein [Desulfobaccales bacterium]